MAPRWLALSAIEQATTADGEVASRHGAVRDIILIGDDAAARNIIAVEIPSLQGGYRASYNPGGPRTSTCGVAHLVRRTSSRS
jgi:hypothetical protein